MAGISGRDWPACGYSVGAGRADTRGWCALALTGGVAECRVLDHLIESVRAGGSQALVVRGEAGVGKTALLDYLAGHDSDCQVERAAGIESEMELVFAGLYQLCAPILDHLDGLSSPQSEALRTVFGLSAGPAPDRFMVALAVLSLLSDVAEERPLLCLVDDVLWMDSASVQVLAFVARRLLAESVGMVFTTRLPSAQLAGVPELAVTRLATADARSLLDAALTAPLDVEVRGQIVAETRGNPLALLESIHGLTALEAAGGFGLPSAGRFAGSIEASLQRRIDELPETTRRLLLLAAAETSGDPAPVWRAAALLGIGADSAAAAVDADLVEFGARVRFRHPLVRSAAYWSASVPHRRQVHHALAEDTDPRIDADRRAWHRAHSAPGPDDDVAAELERCAGRAQARGGLAAAAAFLERATVLTLDPSQRAVRALAAASAKVDAGAFGAALQLLAIAESGPLSEFEQARVDVVRAQLAFVTSHGSDAPPLLLKAARRLEAVDASLSRAAYLDALSSSFFAGRLAVGGGVWEVARYAGAAPQALHEGVSDLPLDGLATHYNAGYAASLPILRKALNDFGSDMSATEELRWLWLACLAAVHTWDDERWNELSERYVQLAREAGALSELPLALSSRMFVLLFAGDLPAVAALAEEVQAVTEVTGGSLTPYGALGLAAFSGRSSEVAALTETTLGDATRRGEVIGVTLVEWANAVLYNGVAGYEDATAAGLRAINYPGDIGGAAYWAAVELVESAVRCGLTEAAFEADRRVAEMASASRTEWAMGVAARSRALLSDGQTAERLYRESIEHLGRTRVGADLARAHLLYGEWLRRERRRTDARTHLRLAHDMLETMGMEAFAGRPRRELHAIGITARTRSRTAGDGELTAQEARIARLASDGLSNPEIGGRLFLSARTVQYHLRSVFAKLGISSRSQLGSVLPSATSATHSG